MPHISGPVPGRVTRVVAGIDFGAQLQQQLHASCPALKSGVVQRRVACGLHLVHVLACVHQSQHLCGEGDVERQGALLGGCANSSALKHAQAARQCSSGGATSTAGRLA